MKLNYKFSLLIVLLLIGLTTTKAQTQCGTNSNIDKSIEANYLLHKANLSSSRMLDSSGFNIPIQFHVTRGSDGLSDFEPRFIDSILTVLNNGFNNTPFHFYQCDTINYIDNDDYETFYYYEPAELDYKAFYNFYNSKTAINVYLPNSIVAVGVGAWAYFPWTENHAYVAPWRSYNSNTHIHEMGHLLGLLHTHSNDELVDGSNCTVKGDLCCDTPAEPSLGTTVNTDCEYIGTAVDVAGEQYNPNPNNFMSYAPRNCRVLFTQDQVDRMTYFYNYYIRKFQCDSDFRYTDISFDNITTLPYPVVEGQPYSIKVTPRNSGNIEARDFKVKVSMQNIDLGEKRIFVLYSSNPQPFYIDDRQEFPHKAGRYLICVETEGDSLEINPLNNKYCEEILVRQKAGIPDIAITALKLAVPQGEQNALNPVSFNLENLGNIIAEDITGNIFVENILVDSFSVRDIEVAEDIQVNLLVPLGFAHASEICIEMGPAFSEERLENNMSCIKFGTTESLFTDLEIDSIHLEPNDSLLIPHKRYKMYFRFKNNGPGIAWNNSSYIKINDNYQDSTGYFLNAGWNPNYSRIDSFEFLLLKGISTVDICAEIKTYKDSLPQNNIFCLSRPVENISNTKDITFTDELKLYPNPIVNSLIIQSTALLENVIIINNLGKMVLSFDQLNVKRTMLNLDELNSGIYYAVIQTTKGRHIKKFIKI